MATCPSAGARARLYVEPGAASGSPASHTFDGSSETYAFVSETLTAKTSVIDAAGIRGSRALDIAQVRTGETVVSGQIVLEPSPEDLDLWLPRITGGSMSSGQVGPGTSLTPFGVLINRVFDTWQYTDCYVNKATFSCQRGQVLRLTVDIIGKTYIKGTSAPSVTMPNKTPYVFSDGGLTLASNTIYFESATVVFDNALSVHAFNSLTATCITPQDRIVTASFQAVPNDFYSNTLETDIIDGLAASLVFTHAARSSTSLTMLMSKFCGGVEDPAVSGKTDIMMTINGRAYANAAGSTSEILFTSVYT